ncbi:MAG: helix-turn-helix transcriptional regulator [Bdellovibrionaceae bacterium]|nr:helix-turn-helix transcriptional regulator [Pseudobdellovibrionaceae bacterium]MBX3033295.1 helix-turn-helix transcriptional regulator [Pseudobdellovibrionaceae bacterium]
MESILGSYLKQKRAVIGLSQSEVASHLGYSTAQYISNFERGVCQPSMKILARLAKLYKLNIDEFFDVVVEQQKQEIASYLYPKNKRKRSR